MGQFEVKEGRPDDGRVGEKREDGHVSATRMAEKREYLVDTCEESSVSRRLPRAASRRFEPPEPIRLGRCGQSSRRFQAAAGSLPLLTLGGGLRPLHERRDIQERQATLRKPHTRGQIHRCGSPEPDHRHLLQGQG